MSLSYGAKCGSRIKCVSSIYKCAGVCRACHNKSFEYKICIRNTQRIPPNQLIISLLNVHASTNNRWRKIKCIHSTSAFRFMEWNWAVKSCINRFDLICIAGQLFHHRRRRRYDTVCVCDANPILCFMYRFVWQKHKAERKWDQSSIFLCKCFSSERTCMCSQAPTSPPQIHARSNPPTPITIHLIIPFILLGRPACIF